MALVYRSIFTDSDGAIAAALGAEFKAWLGSKELSIPDSGLGARGSALSSPDSDVAWASERRTSLSTGDELHRLRLVEELPNERWITSAVAIVPAGSTEARSRARIWVDVEHEPATGRPLKRPGSPRLVRELIGVGEAVDGPVPLTSDAWLVDTGHVDEVAAWITSRARSVPVIVFAHDSKREYDQVKLSRLLARDLAGVATVLRLRDGGANERLAQLLPAEYGVWAGAMRTYLPGASGEDDVPSRHRVLGRTSLVALGPRAFPAVKDQILGLSVEQPSPVASDAKTRSAGGPSLEDRNSRVSRLPSVGPGWLRQRLSRMWQALGTEPARQPVRAAEQTLLDFDLALQDLIERAAANPETTSPPRDDVLQVEAVAEVEAQLQRERQDRETMEELLEELQGDLSTRTAADRQLRIENDDLTLEVTEAAEELDSLERQVRFLQKRVQDLGDSGVGSDESLPPAPPSVAEVVVMARKYLHHVDIGSDVDQTAAELDLHAKAQLFAMKSWSGLCALNAYAKSRAAGDFQGSFHSWCSEPPTGELAISANAVAMVESETVGSSTELRSVRTFDVPEVVAGNGRAYMEAHIKIVKRGTPAPRLHFLDDAGRSGKVYVGYLGEHLPTARFS